MAGRTPFFACLCMCVCQKRVCVCLSASIGGYLGRWQCAAWSGKLTCLWILWRPYFGFFNIATFWNRNILFWISLETIFVYVLDVGLKVYNLYFVGQRMRTRWLGGHHFCVLVHVCVPETCVCVWSERKHRRIPGKMTAPVFGSRQGCILELT